MNITILLQEETCCDCTTHFAMDGSLRTRLLESGGTFYCPNGHGQHYTETEVMRLRKEKQRLEGRLKWAESDAEYLKKEKTALKGQLTKTRNRIANGVCPCCHRTFQQLARHMDNKHPDFKTAVTPATPEEGESNA